MTNTHGATAPPKFQDIVPNPPHCLLNKIKVGVLAQGRTEGGMATQRYEKILLL